MPAKVEKKISSDDSEQISLEEAKIKLVGQEVAMYMAKNTKTGAEHGTFGLNVNLPAMNLQEAEEYIREEKEKGESFELLKINEGAPGLYYVKVDGFLVKTYGTRIEEVIKKVVPKSNK